MKHAMVPLGVAAALCLAGCNTAHKVENGTKNAAKTTGHALGHATDKAGAAISKGGQKLENKTDQ